MKWSPISSTLISGKRDAVAGGYRDHDRSKTRRLSTGSPPAAKKSDDDLRDHGHGDHFFGVNTFRRKFPKARFMATREVIAVMQKQASAPVVNGYWKPRFPGQIDSTLVVADELKGGDGSGRGTTRERSLGHTDTDNTTCLHAYSIGLVVAGDKRL